MFIRDLGRPLTWRGRECRWGVQLDLRTRCLASLSEVVSEYRSEDRRRAGIMSIDRVTSEARLSSSLLWISTQNRWTHTVNEVDFGSKNRFSVTVMAQSSANILIQHIFSRYINKSLKILTAILASCVAYWY